jgi:hypothetical protein
LGTGGAARYLINTTTSSIIISTSHNIRDFTSCEWLQERFEKFDNIDIDYYQNMARKVTVDFHVHILEKREDWFDSTHQLVRRYNQGLYENFDYAMSVEGQLRDMDNCGINYEVLLPEYAPLTHGTITNEFVLKFSSKSKRFIPFASFNPSQFPKPDKVLGKLIDTGFKGLKLIPTYNHFYPNDVKIYPCYKVVQERNIPVLIHTGSSVFKGSKIKYGDPILIDDIAVDFPNLTIIQAHGGRGVWYDRAFLMARLHQNVYIDIAGLPAQNLLRYYPEIEKIQDKIVFGSDWPVIPSRKEAIEIIESLPLGEVTKGNILGGTACKLLKIQ